MSHDFYSRKLVRAEVDGKAQSRPARRRARRRRMLSVATGIIGLTIAFAAHASNQDPASVNAGNFEVQGTQQQAVADPAAELSDTVTEPQTLPYQPAEQNQPRESGAEYWRNRVNALLDEIDRGSKTPDNADVLYEELSQHLRKKREALRLVLRWAGSPSDEVDQSTLSQDTEITTAREPVQPVTVQDVYSDMVSLYQTRISLLQAVSPRLAALITGFSEAGQRKFKGEMEYMLLYLSFHSMAIPQLGPRLLDELTAAPIPFIWEFLKLVLAVILFRWWRQWAPQGLVNLRGRIVRIRPRTQHSLRLARLVWYLQQVRSPLEWMLFVSIVFGVIAMPSLLVIEDFVHIILSGVLFAWFAVLLINAIASRGVAGLSDDTSGLRLRSLKLIAAWILLLGLGLKLTETYTGEGTIYAWVWTVFQILSIPVVMLLLAWWRNEIKQDLEELPALPGWVAKTKENRKGPRKYLDTLLAGIYLVFVLLRQFGIRQLSKFESGREVVIRLIGRDLYREQEKKAQALDTKAISSELAEKLLAGEMQISEKVFSKELKYLSETVEFGHAGLVAVIGERGAGKSLLLTRLAEKFEDKAIIVQCTMQGFDGIRQALAEKFSTPADQLNADRLAELVALHEIRFIAIDNLHLLTRPKMGGLTELNRLSEFFAPLRSSVETSLIITLVKPAYQYLSSLRSERAMLDDVIELPAWTLEQISELVEARSRGAGIEPDFSEINIPYEYDDIDYDSPDERTRSGFYRILWNVSAGNPAVAVRLWCESLAVTPEGRVIVQILPEVFAVDQLENARLSTLLMLRVIVQSGLTSAEDIAESLRLPSTVIGSGIRFALLRDWIEETDGYYQITWRWFRTINRVLKRQNLLTN